MAKAIGTLANKSQDRRGLQWLFQKRLIEYQAVTKTQSLIMPILTIFEGKFNIWKCGSCNVG